MPRKSEFTLILIVVLSWKRRNLPESHGHDFFQSNFSMNERTTHV